MFQIQRSACGFCYVRVFFKGVPLLLQTDLRALQLTAALFSAFLKFFTESHMFSTSPNVLLLFLKALLWSRGRRGESSAATLLTTISPHFEISPDIFERIRFNLNLLGISARLCRCDNVFNWEISSPIIKASVLIKAFLFNYGARLNVNERRKVFETLLKFWRVLILFGKLISASL
jgi:hypothetical protein